MACCHMFVLFLATVTATPRSQLPSETEEILQQLLSSKQIQQHVRNDLEHDHHHNQHHDDHDRTNIETLNLIFKHNKIVPTGSPGAPSKSIARTGDDRGDLLCRLGARCGCGGNSQRCGCGRSDGLCDQEHDHSLDNAIILKPNPDYDNSEKEKTRYGNDKKNHVDPKIVKLLDDFENALLIQSNGNKNAYEIVTGEDDDKKSSNYVDLFLKDLDNLLDNPDKIDDESAAHLRCCQDCARSGNYRTIDDRTYLRCCDNCGNSKFFRARNSDRRDRDDDRDRRDKFDDRDRRNRNDDKDRRDRNDRDRRDKSDFSPRIFQLNNDLDAIVLDVSDIDSVLKVLNNGNKFDNVNSIKDYIKGVNGGSGGKSKTSKYQNRLLPTMQQKIRINDIYRRNGRPTGDQYGVPFEMNVEGLGQINQ